MNSLRRAAPPARSLTKGRVRSAASTDVALASRKREAAEKQPRGEAVVKAVIAATVDELGRVGYSGLSIDAVAQRANVNKTTVYRRWPTKVDLVMASIQAAKAELRCPDTGSLRSDLLLLLGAIRDFMTTNEGRCFFRLFTSEAEERTDLLRVFKAMREKADDPPRLVLSRAIARGELSPNVDPHLLMLSMVNALKHLILFEGESVSDQRIESIVDLMLYGAATNRPRKKVR